MSHYATPELLQWVRTQQDAGYPRQDLIKAMVAQGWSEVVAQDTLAAARPQADAAAPSARPGKAEPQRLKVPELALDGSPLTLDAGDRQVAVLGVVRNPTIVMLGGLLSDEECDALIESARPAMKRSDVLDMATGASKVDQVRTSNGMFFKRGQTELVARVEARIARLTGWPLENGEGVQVLQYGPGAEYRPHYDYFDPASPGSRAILQRGGQRVGTMLVYLNQPVRGGGTLFPDVGLEVSARRGMGVFFSYDTPHPSSRTLHGGSPVLEGEKWVMTKWLRENAFG